MPRRKREWLVDATYHVTHRCHNRAFLFRFQVDRNEYVRRLFEMKRRYPVKVLDYMVTGNHVHLLVSAKKPEAVSEGLRFLQGTMAQFYNHRKNREGAFWRGRFHTTLIQNGVHLARCLLYVECNMVRAGVVSHPSEWRWSGYDELTGERRRYRILDMPTLLRKLRADSEANFRDWLAGSLEARLAAGAMAREPMWSEATAIGGHAWIGRVGEGLPEPLKRTRTVPGPAPGEPANLPVSVALRTSKFGRRLVL